MTPKCHVRFGGGLGEKEHCYLARSLPSCGELCLVGLGRPRGNVLGAHARQLRPDLHGVLKPNRCLVPELF
jgi:hypothetical protein